MSSRFIGQLIILFALHHVFSFNIKLNRSVNQKFASKSRISMGVEHLVNCAGSGYLLSTDMCLDTNIQHNLQILFVDMFQSVATIGMLIATYYYMRRLSRVSPTSVSVPITSNDEISYSQTTSSSLQECPKCNGSGQNLFNRKQTCDLCGGKGQILAPRMKRYYLPSKPKKDRYEM